jgi:hypothetical protein
MTRDDSVGMEGFAEADRASTTDPTESSRLNRIDAVGREVIAPQILLQDEE